MIRRFLQRKPLQLHRSLLLDFASRFSTNARAAVTWDRLFNAVLPSLLYLNNLGYRPQRLIYGLTIRK